MTKFVSLASFKGGVGKSSLAVNIAGIAARDYAKRVLLIDADENETASSWFRTGTPPYDVVKTTDPDDLAKLRRITKYDLVVIDLPGHRDQALIDLIERSSVDLIVMPSRANPQDMAPVMRMWPAITGESMLVFTMTTPGRDPDVDEYREHFEQRGLNIAHTVIRQSKGWSKAGKESRLVLDLGRFSSAKTDARALTHEIMEKIDA